MSRPYAELYLKMLARNKNKTRKWYEKPGTIVLFF